MITLSELQTREFDFHSAVMSPEQLAEYAQEHGTEITLAYALLTHYRTHLQIGLVGAARLELELCEDTALSHYVVDAASYGLERLRETAYERADAAQAIYELALNMQEGNADVVARSLWSHQVEGLIDEHGYGDWPQAREWAAQGCKVEELVYVSL